MCISFTYRMNSLFIRTVLQFDEEFSFFWLENENWILILSLCAESWVAMILNIQGPRLTLIIPLSTKNIWRAAELRDLASYGYFTRGKSKPISFYERKKKLIPSLVHNLKTILFISSLRATLYTLLTDFFLFSERKTSPRRLQPQASNILPLFLLLQIHGSVAATKFLIN